MASLDYWPFYHSYLRTTSYLSDGELGRLVRSCTQFSMGEEWEQLDGREEAAFYFITEDISRAKENYAKKCAKNLENGSKGGRPLKTEDNPKNPTVFSETQKSQSKSKSKSKSKDKSKSHSSTPLTPLPGEWGPDLAAAVEDWFAYKAEKRQTYKPQGRQNLVSIVTGKVSQYSEKAVVDVIRASMAANYQGIVWAWLDEKPAQNATKSAKRPFGESNGTPGAAEAEYVKRLQREAEKLKEGR